eukprot:162111-Prymnesium_polylepis.2
MAAHHLRPLEVDDDRAEGAPLRRRGLARVRDGARRLEVGQSAGCAPLENLFPREAQGEQWDPGEDDCTQRILDAIHFKSRQGWRRDEKQEEADAPTAEAGGPRRDLPQPHAPSERLPFEIDCRPHRLTHDEMRVVHRHLHERGEDTSVCGDQAGNPESATTHVDSVRSFCAAAAVGPEACVRQRSICRRQAQLASVGGEPGRREAHQAGGVGRIVLHQLRLRKHGGKHRRVESGQVEQSGLRPSRRTQQ